MKKDSKGFTLVELLAAIVILGILVGVSVPIIVNLLDTTRSKMYIDDAKKLVAQAEYKLKANSSSIEKPDEGDCIAISMVYLDSSDFDNPPNEGNYEKESSFVIVKNNGGKLEYSVTIVEKVKNGGYKGVELVKSSDLLGSNAIKHVVNFKKSEIVNVDIDVNKGYVNGKLGNNYIGSDNAVSAIYNYPDLVDSSAIEDATGTPKITFASLISTSSKEYNSLDATLQLKAEDKDTPINKLNVYLSVDGGYNEATSAIPYGDNDAFSYNFNLKNYGKSYDGSSVKVYIIIKDPEGNEVRKTMTYQIHNNVAPEIDGTSSIKKRNSDVKNMTTALLNLIVSDDIDDINSLSVCLKESSTDDDFESCNNYKKYTEYFNTDNLMEYTFSECSGGCKRDGSTHYLTAFVKDSLDGISKKKFKYTFSTNTAPVIESLSIKSQVENFTSAGSKTIAINVDASDDVDNSNKLKVVVSDGISTTTYNYSPQPIYHTINSLYDGSTKTIKVKVVDSENASNEQTKNYTLYQNQKPTINSFNVVSSTAPCNNQDLCLNDEGGSKNVNILLDAKDDIDYANNYANLAVCISLNENTCTNYSSYSNYANKSYSYVVDGNYDGSTKNIYVFVKDTYGQISKKSVAYKLYKNKAPVVEVATFDSITSSKPVNNNLKSIFRINAYDDFDSDSSLKLQIIEDGVIKVNNANLSNYLNKDNDYTFAGGYDGNTRNIVIKVTDSSSLTTTKEISYQVYHDAKPVINSFDVYNKEIPCKYDKYCSLESNGNYNAYYKLDVSDDLDSNNDLKICVSETDSCSDYSSYSNYYDESSNPKEFSHVFSVNNSTKPYDGSIKHLYLFVKDSYGNITKKDYQYKLYENTAPIILNDAELVSNATDLDMNILNATYTVSAIDDLDSNFKIKYCYKKNGGSEVCTAYEDYHETKILDNSFFNVTRPSGEQFVVYAKLKDSYDAEVKTNEITYKLYTDINPSIQSSTLVSGKNIYKNSAGNVVESTDSLENSEDYDLYTRMKINFSVDDPYDTYSVCVSENSSSCTKYEGVFEGTNCEVPSDSCTSFRKTYSVYYDKLGSVSNGDHVSLYLFVKDSYGNIVKKNIYDADYNLCDDLDYEDAYHEYVFNEELTRSETGSSEAISIDRCAGKCYYYNSKTDEYNDIVAYYKLTISYTDKINSSVACPSALSVDTEHRVGCDFKDCFYKNNNYNRKAIGNNLIYDDSIWTVNINGIDYECDSHYKLYLSSYNDGKLDITLTETNNKICKAAFDNNVYAYDSRSLDPYVIVDD